MLLSRPDRFRQPLRRLGHRRQHTVQNEGGRDENRDESEPHRLGVEPTFPDPRRRFRRADRDRLFVVQCVLNFGAQADGIRVLRIDPQRLFGQCQRTCEITPAESLLGSGQLALALLPAALRFLNSHPARFSFRSSPRRL